MKKFFYTIFVIIGAWLFAFLKTEIFFKKYSCSSNLNIYYSKDLQFNTLCSDLDEMYKKIGEVNLNIKIILLPNWLYKVLTINSVSRLYLNIFNRYVYFNDSFKIDFDTKSELFSKIYSLKLLNKTPLLSYFSIPKWKIKGYSLYIYDEYSRFNINDFCQEINRNRNYISFENKIVVKYLIEVKGYNEERIFDDNLSYKYYLDEARFFYCK